MLQFWQQSALKGNRKLGLIQSKQRKCDVETQKLAKKRKILQHQEKVTVRQIKKWQYFVNNPLFHGLQDYLPLTILHLCQSYMTFDWCTHCDTWHPCVLNCTIWDYKHWFQGSYFIHKDSVVFEM